ncbi:hypothetical protein HUE87_00875 [Candidatus Sulfurimonas marisnigri]|uniref:Uncharacterized protein n=1 Tax=Candidatus Sulfurimonas marisnigri TaxID=2740405 RepID=A0A7S7RQM8_9BACT|nr:hypothetical protein [Candidatus Sulfurimonas marisnigri]QOY54836.1 hypothetical protein HUE87_00875 [Candidatus Sulfurimonas marisnigri]
MNNIEQQCKQILTEQNIDIFSEIDFDINGKVHTLSFNYIVETFMLASDESQLVFITALKKAIEAKEMGINKFFEGMGQLLLMTHLSEKM